MKQIFHRTVRPGGATAPQREAGPSWTLRLSFCVVNLVNYKTVIGLSSGGHFDSSPKVSWSLKLAFQPVSAWAWWDEPWIEELGRKLWVPSEKAAWNQQHQWGARCGSKIIPSTCLGFAALLQWHCWCGGADLFASHVESGSAPWSWAQCFCLWQHHLWRAVPHFAAAWPGTSKSGFVAEHFSDWGNSFRYTWSRATKRESGNGGGGLAAGERLWPAGGVQRGSAATGRCRVRLLGSCDQNRPATWAQLLGVPALLWGAPTQWRIVAGGAWLCLGCCLFSQPLDHVGRQGRRHGVLCVAEGARWNLNGVNLFAKSTRAVSGVQGATAPIKRPWS